MQRRALFEDTCETSGWACVSDSMFPLGAIGAERVGPTPDRPAAFCEWHMTSFFLPSRSRCDLFNRRN